MVLPLYLAQTRCEMGGNSPMPNFLAYMSVHFSPGGTGLSNFPDILPPGTLLILDDSTPMYGHDPDRIIKELSGLMERHQCEGLLLDFQRPGYGTLAELAKAVTDALPCPVGVSELYAEGLSCPVFLSPVPPDRPLRKHLAPWTGREIWLELGLDGEILTLTEQGCTVTPLPFPDPDAEGFYDATLNCHYTVETNEKAARFTLWRTKEDLNTFLEAAETSGIAKTVGLYQELR